RRPRLIQSFSRCHPERSEGPMQLAWSVGAASGMHRSFAQKNRLRMTTLAIIGSHVLPPVSDAALARGLDRRSDLFRLRARANGIFRPAEHPSRREPGRTIAEQAALARDHLRCRVPDLFLALQLPRARHRKPLRHPPRAYLRDA